MNAIRSAANHAPPVRLSGRDRTRVIRNVVAGRPGVVVAGDQATKYWITHHVAVGATIRRILSGEVLVWNNPNSLTADGVFLGVPPW